MLELFKFSIQVTMESVRINPLESVLLILVIFGTLALLFWPIPPRKAGR